MDIPYDIILTTYVKYIGINKSLDDFVSVKAKDGFYNCLNLTQTYLNTDATSKIVAFLFYFMFII